MNFRIVYSVQRTAFSLLSAALLILAFPPFNLWVLAWIAFIPLFFAIEGQKPLNAFMLSYLAGFLFFLGTMYWMIHVTLPGMIAVAVYLALYFGIFGLIINYSRLPTPNSQLFLIPATWVALEWARSYVFTGFGWALLGYSQSQNLPIIQVADLSGTYGVSFLIVIFNAAVFFVIKNFRKNKGFLFPMVISVVLITVSLGYGSLRLNNVFTGERLKVSVVQGNIPQDQKWDERFIEKIIRTYTALTVQSSAEKPDLIIWPETSVPGFIENSRTLMEWVRALAVKADAPLLIGAPRYEDVGGEELYYNSAFLFLKDGSIARHYDKIHLVPFGEYVPLSKFFFFVQRFAPRPIGDFVGGKEFTVLRFPVERSVKEKGHNWKLLKKVGFGCLICFEDIFPDLARGLVKNNAGFLVNITNDAWFGRSSAAYQHAQASVFRAVENRVNVIRAANTGLSCFIDQKGRVISKVTKDGKDLFVDGYRVQEIVLSKIRTVYTVYGDLFAYLCIFFTVFCLSRSIRRGGQRMRFPVKSATLLLIALSLYGCDSNQYQIVTGSDGALYRFNKKTGSLSIIMKDKKVLNSAQPQRSEVAEDPHASALDKPVSWKESKYPGKDLYAKFEMIWRENKLCYRFSVYPYKSLERAFVRKKQDYIYSLMKPGFTVELLDKNGFLVKDIKVNLWSMNSVDGDDGMPKEAVLNSQIDCTEQSYRSICGYTVKWGLDSEMIEDDVGDYIRSAPIKSER